MTGTTAPSPREGHGADPEFSSADVTVSTADRLIREVEEEVDAGGGVVEFPRRGRPSLSGAAKSSPLLAFRVSSDMRRLLEVLAEQEGVTVSSLARQALDEWLMKKGARP